MTDEIKALIESLRRGQYEDPAEKVSLLSAALQESKADMAMLLSLLRAPQVPLRLAAMDACRERDEPELISELCALAENPEARIRLKLAEVIRGRTTGPAIRALQILLGDAEDEVREAALKSTSGQPEFRVAQEKALAEDSRWRVRLAAASALEGQKNPVVVKPLLIAVGRDGDDDVRRRCAEIVEQRLKVSQQLTASKLPVEIGQLCQIERHLTEMGAQRFPELIAWARSKTTVTVDPEVLAKYGTDLTALAANQSLPRAHCAEESCAALLKLVLREPWRSVALLGPTGAGKSALVNELVHELAQSKHGNWRVLRVSPSDFMAGTRYLGEWETRVRELVEAVRKPRRVLIYVPNLSDLSAVGTWAKSSSSVATALAPYMEDGSILLLGESTPEEFERGLGRIPSLHRLFDKVLMPEASVDQTRHILAGVREAEKSTISDDVLEQLLEVSGQFLGHVSRPGNAVELLRGVVKTEKESGATVTYRHVLELVSRTGDRGFYQDPAARQATFDEIHKLEQFLSLHSGLGKVLLGLSGRLERNPLTKLEEAPLNQRLQELSSELDHLRLVAHSQNGRDLGDAIVTLSLVSRDGAVQGAVPRLAAMYRGLASCHRMTAEVLGEFYDDQRDMVHLLISGLGAYALLKNESGLHQMDRRYKERVPRAGREVMREDRELVRVEVLPVPQEPSKPFKQQVKTKVSALKPARERLKKTPLCVSLFHEPSLRSLEFWTGGTKEEALELGFLILHAQGGGAAGAGQRDVIVRHYDVGLAPKIKDTRTGQITTQVEQVFKGNLGSLLRTEGE